jgi:hypothetical protein
LYFRNAIAGLFLHLLHDASFSRFTVELAGARLHASLDAVLQEYRHP